MMKSIINRLALLSLLAALGFSACKKEKVQIGHLLDCAALETGLIERQSEVVRTEINALLEDLSPAPDTSDSIGHLQNLQMLVSSLNNNCAAFTAVISCYACIYTLPAQSEIEITLDSVGMAIDRIIDISTPEDDSLKFAGIH